MSEKPLKAFVAAYGDARYDIDATTCVVFAATHGKARSLAAKQFECDFTSVSSCKRLPRLDRYGVKGELTDREYIKEGWSVGCPKCESMADEYTARFGEGSDYLVGCEYCEEASAQTTVGIPSGHQKTENVE